MACISESRREARGAIAILHRTFHLPFLVAQPRHRQPVSIWGKVVTKEINAVRSFRIINK